MSYKCLYAQGSGLFQGYHWISHRHVVDFIYILHKAHPRYEQGYVIRCVANLTEENSFLSLFELGTGL